MHWVLPEILVLLCGDHAGARCRRAELRDRPVEHVDLVVEVHNVHSQPLVHVLAIGQLHRLGKRGARAERLFRVAPDLPVVRHLLLLLLLLLLLHLKLVELLLRPLLLCKRRHGHRHRRRGRRVRVPFERSCGSDSRDRRPVEVLL